MLLALATSATAATRTWTSGQTTCQLKDDGTFTVTATYGVGSMDNYGYTNQPWNSAKDDIKKVIISTGVSNVGNFAFYDCQNLEEVNINSTVLTIIGEQAFSFCFELKTVDLSSSTPLQIVGASAFWYCSLIESITFPASIMSIGNYAFSDCNGLRRVYFTSASLPTLGEAVFQNNADDRLFISKSADFDPSAWKSVGRWSDYADDIARCYTSGTTNCYLSNDGTFTVSGNGPMADYSSSANRPWHDVRDQIKKVVVEDGVTEIGDLAFYDCKALTSITIPNSVTWIGQLAFWDCDLKEIRSFITEPFGLEDGRIDFDAVLSVLYVPYGTKTKYKATPYWNEFQKIYEIGDVNSNGDLNLADVEAISKFIMDSAPSGFSEGAADLNGDGKVDVADIVMLVDIINGK